MEAFFSYLDKKPVRVAVALFVHTMVMASLLFAPIFLLPL
jgi:hypothetical protein